MPERFLRVFDQSKNLMFETHIPPGMGVGALQTDEDTYEVSIGGGARIVSQVDAAPDGSTETEAVADAHVVEVFKASFGLRPEWRFRVKADNGEIIAASEGYRRRKDAVTAGASFGDVVFV